MAAFGIRHGPREPKNVTPPLAVACSPADVLYGFGICRLSFVLLL